MNRLRATPVSVRGNFFSAALPAAMIDLSLVAASADVITQSKFETTGLFGLAAFKSESEARQSADKRDDRTKTFFT